MSLAVGIARHDTWLVASEGRCMDAAGKNVIAEDAYKHICLSPDVALASCGGGRGTRQLFTDAIEGWAVKSPCLATVEFLKCAFNKWYREPTDPNGSIPGAFGIYPEADGMGALIMEWGNPKIDIYHIAPNETPLILSFSPSQTVTDYVMSALRFFADRFCNLPRSEFENVMRSVIGQVFGQATKLDSRLNDRVRIATRGCAEVGRIHSPNLNSQLWRRVSAVSSGNQCQTGSIVSGAVNNAVATSISGVALPNDTNEHVIDTLTITANGGFVEAHYGGYALNSGSTTFHLTFRIRKGSVTGSQMGQVTEVDIGNAGAIPDWSLRGIDPSPATGSVSYVITAQASLATSLTSIYGGGFVANRQV